MEITPFSIVLLCLPATLLFLWLGLVFERLFVRVVFVILQLLWICRPELPLLQQKDTATTTALAQAPSIHQKQVDKVAAKHKDSFCTQSSHVVRLVKKVQPFQPQVRDDLQQTKQHDGSNQASNSPRFRFSNRCPLSPGNSMQWRPLLPKEGGLIQVHIGGHPPSPTSPKHVFGNFDNLLIFSSF